MALDSLGLQTLVPKLVLQQVLVQEQRRVLEFEKLILEQVELKS